MSKKSARPALDRLRIRHCRLLEMLAAHESLRKAASLMGVSQPVASQMLAEIEAAFGVTLFTRSRNGLRATARLPAVLRRIRNVVNEFDAAHAEAAPARDVDHAHGHENEDHHGIRDTRGLVRDRRDVTVGHERDAGDDGCAAERSECNVDSPRAQ